MLQIIFLIDACVAIWQSIAAFAHTGDQLDIHFAWGLNSLIVAGLFGYAAMNECAERSAPSIHEPDTHT